MKKNAVFSKKKIQAHGFLNDPTEYKRSFSRGLKISLGPFSLVIISGTASVGRNGESLHKGNFNAQAQRTFNNLTALLESEGACWNNVVQTRCYLKNMKDYGKFNMVRNKFYKENKIKIFPASVCIEAGLCRPELLVEIEALAICNKIISK